jgi:hypothetical protein
VKDLESKQGSEVHSKLEELIRLNQGWDGYTGQPVSLDKAMFALSLLGAVCAENTPAPQVIPTARGEIQLEWHTETTDIELLVKAPNKVHAWRECTLPNEHIEEEFDLTTNFIIIAQWIKSMQEENIALALAA